jgi:hypothetical protein
MSFRSPNYIPIAQIQSMPIVHKWSDWDPYEIVGRPKPDTMEQLGRVSDRANIAYAIGCAEWVIYRFKLINSETSPLYFIEASWAFEMDEGMDSPPESDEEEWKGPIRGPMDLALMTILNTYYSAENNAAEVEAAFAELIPLHVLTDIRPFLDWRESAISRLQMYYQRDSNNLAGSSVPREALDPSVDLKLSSSEELVRAFLENLDWTGNPYLRRLDEGQSNLSG